MQRLEVLFLAVCVGSVLAGPSPLFANTYSVTVSGQANIFGAGHATPPDPGGYGGGVLPPVVPLLQGADVAVYFGSVAGTVCYHVVGCLSNPDGFDPALRNPTDITSYGGISGILHGETAMFLVGVFLSDEEPVGPAPPRLDFSAGALTDNFPELAPALDQTFFIGDGQAQGGPQVFRPPPGATRLFLGFADAASFGNPTAPPGYYGDNSGELIATVTVVTEPRIMVSGQANIFGAGHAVAPAPGGGGGGALPPLVPLPQAAGVFVQVESATGTVCPSASPACYSNPDGGQRGPWLRTDITSCGGLSGIIHGESTMFLAGVFLGDQEPVDPAPPRLDFSAGALTDEFLELSPALNQTFFIGDGRAQGTPQTFRAPPGATRLFLGFADAWSFGDPISPPGYYGDNEGALWVDLLVSVDGAIPVRRTTLGWLKAKYR